MINIESVKTRYDRENNLVYVITEYINKSLFVKVYKIHIPYYGSKEEYIFLNKFYIDNIERVINDRQERL
jgi:hypothetical protein